MPSVHSKESCNGNGHRREEFEKCAVPGTASKKRRFPSESLGFATVKVTRQLDGKLDTVGVEEICTVSAGVCGEAFDFLLPRVVREVERRIIAQN